MDIFAKMKLILLIYNTIFSLISIGVVIRERIKDGSWMSSCEATTGLIYILISPIITWAIFTIFGL